MRGNLGADGAQNLPDIGGWIHNEHAHGTQSKLAGHALQHGK